MDNSRNGSNSYRRSLRRLAGGIHAERVETLQATSLREFPRIPNRSGAKWSPRAGSNAVRAIRGVHPEWPLDEAMPEGVDHRLFTLELGVSLAALTLSRFRGIGDIVSV